MDILRIKNKFVYWETNTTSRVELVYKQRAEKRKTAVGRSVPVVPGLCIYVLAPFYQVIYPLLVVTHQTLAIVQGLSLDSTLVINALSLHVCWCNII
jgi:hypothetical protein